MSDILQSMLGVLVRAYQSGKDKLPASKAARHFVEECGFGTVIGSSWHLGERDRKAIRAYLVEYHGITHPEIVDFSFADKSRVDAAAITPQEKYAGAGPHEGYVLMRAPSRTIRLNGISTPTAGRACLYIDVREVRSIEHDCLVIVENFEAVKCFENVIFHDFPYHDPLVVFRGDAAFPSNGARTLATGASVPVIAWTDLDPQGVNIAASIPNVCGAVFPSQFEALSRADLYDRQRFLLKELAAYPAGWREPVAAMTQVRRCLTQETMIARQVPCRLYWCDGHA